VFKASLEGNGERKMQLGIQGVEGYGPGDDDALADDDEDDDDGEEDDGGEEGEDDGEEGGKRGRRWSKNMGMSGMGMGMGMGGWTKGTKKLLGISAEKEKKDDGYTEGAPLKKSSSTGGFIGA
jgi:hypothetical protein